MGVSSYENWIDDIAAKLAELDRAIEADNCLLVAQARLENLTLITHDRAIEAYDVAMLMI